VPTPRLNDEENDRPTPLLVHAPNTSRDCAVRTLRRRLRSHISRHDSHSWTPSSSWWRPGPSCPWRPWTGYPPCTSRVRRGTSTPRASSSTRVPTPRWGQAGGLKGPVGELVSGGTSSW